MLIQKIYCANKVFTRGLILLQIPLERINFKAFVTIFYHLGTKNVIKKEFSPQST